MATIITVTNEKGGVGKTTSVVNIAAVLASLGKKILVVDNDPQGNATSLLGIERSALAGKSLAEAMLAKAPLDNFILPTNMENVDLLAGSPQLREVISTFGNGHWQDKLMRKTFTSARMNDYDMVLIDTHGTVDCLLKSALAVSHYYLIPLFAEPDSARGLYDVLATIGDVREASNPKLSLLGILITKFDAGSPTHREFEVEIRRIGKRSRFRIFANMIPSSRSIQTASRDQKALLQYRTSLPATKSYLALGGELLTILRGQRTGRPAIPDTKGLAAEIEEMEEIVWQ